VSVDWTGGEAPQPTRETSDASRWSIIHQGYRAPQPNPDASDASRWFVTHLGYRPRHRHPRARGHPNGNATFPSQQYQLRIPTSLPSAPAAARFRFRWLDDYREELSLGQELSSIGQRSCRVIRRHGNIDRQPYAETNLRCLIELPDEKLVPDETQALLVQSQSHAKYPTTAPRGSHPSA